MKPINVDTAGLDRRVMQNIRFHARRLARNNAVPGMDLHDYEQDLTADLLHRRHAFDPAVASFATFADRVIRHRASTLRTPTLRSVAERKMESLDSKIVDAVGHEYTLLDILSDPYALTEDDIILGIDMRRFVTGFGEREWQTCAVLLSDSISDGARSAGIDRSTAYDRIDKLCYRAKERGLADYVTGLSDTSTPPQVNGLRERTADSQERPAMSSRRKAAPPRLIVTEPALARWISKAAPGETTEYFRGLLLADRDRTRTRLRAADRKELCRVADRAWSTAECGLVHLLQRRYGPNDYGYLIVASAPASNGMAGAAE
jgi:hypothetical protein